MALFKDYSERMADEEAKRAEKQRKAEAERRNRMYEYLQLKPKDGLLHVTAWSSTKFYTGPKTAEDLETALSFIQGEGYEIEDVKPVFIGDDKGITGEAERVAFFIFYK